MSGKTGVVIASTLTPDLAETYMSPLIYDNSNGESIVVFGTGGETFTGSLWTIKLQDLLDQKIENATKIADGDETTGYIAPPVLVDINKDGTDDIIAASFGGKLVAIDGETFSNIWLYEFENTGTYVAPALANFNNDETPDIFVTYTRGNPIDGGLPEGVLLLAVDGETGDVLMTSEQEGIFRGSAVAVKEPGHDLDTVYMILGDVPLDNEKNEFSEPKNPADLLLKINPDGWQVEIERIIEPGKSWSTPQLGDMNQDGNVDLFYTSGTYLGQLIDLGFAMPESISWGSYMGTSYDGRYTY